MEWFNEFWSLYPNLVTAAGTAVFGIIVWLALRLVLSVSRFKKSYLAKLLVNLVLVLVVVSVVQEAGVNLSAAAAVLGVAGLAISLAVSPAGQQAFAGVLNGIDGVFEVGDIIVVDGNTMKIEKLGILSADCVTPTGVHHFVPNGKLFADVVTNWKDTGARHTMTVYVEGQDIPGGGPNPHEVLEVFGTAVAHLSTFDSSEYGQPPAFAVYTHDEPDSRAYDVHMWMRDPSEFPGAHRDGMLAIWDAAASRGWNLARTSNLSGQLTIVNGGA